MSARYRRRMYPNTAEVEGTVEERETAVAVGPVVAREAAAMVEPAEARGAVEMVVKAAVVKEGVEGKAAGAMEGLGA